MKNGKTNTCNEFTTMNAPIYLEVGIINRQILKRNMTNTEESCLKITIKLTGYIELKVVHAQDQIRD